MNKEWDHNKGGRDAWISWLSLILEEVYRVLKPGAHGLIWAIPRTSHWTAFAAENAGFEIRDIVHHAAGSGMPMGQNISKAFDRRLGEQGEPISERVGARNGNGGNSVYGGFETAGGGTYLERAPSSELAHKWRGWHTRLKPAIEHWILVRKLHSGTVIDNIENWGVGALNIEACRVPSNDGFEKAWDKPVSTNMSAEGYVLLTMAQHTVDLSENKPSGRFPANFILSHDPGCNEASGCVDGCSIKILDQQSGNTKSQRGKTKQEKEQWIGESTERGFSDGGGASRFFNIFPVDTQFGYYAKVASTEKYFLCKTCDVILPFIKNKIKLYENHKHHDMVAHPTPKSLKLMRWLITLITPPGGIVLDPFVGAGSTAIACKDLDFSCCGIDLDEDYIRIAQWRLDH